MRRTVLSILVPPLAVYRYGCGYCAAPITLFWVTAITGLVYGLFFGGPLGLATVSWSTVGLGTALWAIASVWSLFAVRTVEGGPRGVCRALAALVDEHDPFDDVGKAR